MQVDATTASLRHRPGRERQATRTRELKQRGIERALAVCGDHRKSLISVRQAEIIAGSFER
ncbi:MAG TPA: hypothetical protein VIY50_05105 [Steroidobacteraceae bacterium]